MCSCKFAGLNLTDDQLIARAAGVGHKYNAKDKHPKPIGKF